MLSGFTLTTFCFPSIRTLIRIRYLQILTTPGISCTFHLLSETGEGDLRSELQGGTGEKAANPSYPFKSDTAIQEADCRFRNKGWPGESPPLGVGDTTRFRYDSVLKKYIVHAEYSVGPDWRFPFANFKGGRGPRCLLRGESCGVGRKR